MFRFYSVLACIFILGLTSCGSGNADNEPTTPADASSMAKASLSDFNWLAGWWQNVTPEGVVFEQWTTTGNVLAGKGGFIRGADTMIAETISLEQKGDDILYIPTVMGQNDGMPIPFRLTYARADSFVFENPEHDFPSLITYHKLSENRLTARISGKIQGEYRSESFELSRIQ